MPGPSAILFNHQTNTYEEVPAEQVGAAISSGQYTAAGSTATTAEGGTVIRPAEQLGAAATQGETQAGAANASRAAEARRAEQVGLNSDKALTFAEGVTDALTVGLIHETGDRADMRREADSGSMLAGELLGTALGLKLPGPIRGITSGGEALGGGLARALLGDAATGFRSAAIRGLEEAGANSALMAASAFGHQVTDSVIADKPFAAEAILSEAGIGALMGFGLGFTGSALGQLARASRGAVEASGVATKESEAALNAVNDLTRTWDDAVEQHAQRVGVLRVLADDGHIPQDLHVERADLLRRAENARDALRELDPERSLGGDPKEFQKWRGAVEKYQDAVMALDEKMTPSMMERASGSPVKLGESPNMAPPQRLPYDVDAAEAAKGVQYKAGLELDQGMRGAGKDWTELKGATGEELRAKYQEIYGRPFEETPKPFNTDLDEANLGGKKTATSELGTNVKANRQIRAREVLEAGDRPIAFKETGAEFVGGVKTEVDRAAQRVVEPGGKTIVDVPAENAGGRSKTVADRTVVDVPPDLGQTVVDRPAGASIESSAKPVPEGKAAVRNYLNKWFKEFDSKPRVSLGDQLQVRLTEALDSIAKASGGRLDSVGGLQLLKSLGLKEATSPLGQRLDQVWSLGQAGKFAADEARGVQTPLRKSFTDRVLHGVAHRGARAAGAAVLGGALGGPVGAIAGAAFISAGFAGAAASTAGKVMQQIGKVGEALLKGRRATLMSRAIVGNRPYQYSDAGPIKDPVQRVIEVQRMAANPDAIKARVTKQLGDLVVTSPEIAQQLADITVRNVQAISASAPAIMMTPLGKPVKPSGTAMNKFLDFENAMHDLPGTLSALANGKATPGQVKAIQIGYPAVHGALVKEVFGNKDGLDQLEEAKLRTIERALGVPLTRATVDPLITSRLQGNWEAPKPPPATPQAFKITAPKPTPVQASSGDRAPGNEPRKP